LQLRIEKIAQKKRESKMIKELIKLSTSLDEKGFTNEANYLDVVIQKIAEEYGSFDENPQSEEYQDYEDQAMIEESMKASGNAEMLADLIAAGDPAMGHDENILKERLTALFLEDSSKDFVSKVIGILRNT